MTYVNGVKALAMHNKVGKKRKLVPRNVKDAVSYTHLTLPTKA